MLRPLRTTVAAALALTCMSVLAQPASAAYTILERVSGGNNPTGNAAQPAAFAEASEDGTRQFFDTKESLATDDTDASTDVYERSPGAVTRISAGATNGNGAFDALYAASSEDGARVFFHTKEALVSGDTDGGKFDVYRRFNGATTLISTGPATTNAGVDAFLRGISLDGTRAFFETSEVLTSTDVDSSTDVYERNGATTTLVSVGPTSAPGAFDAIFKAASANGNRVFFETSDKLVSSDLDSSNDVYQYQAGTTTLMSTGPDGGNGAMTANLDAISETGTRLYFHTNEPLVAADTDGFSDVYERSGTTLTQVSVGPNGGNGPRHADFAGASSDGTRIFFETDESLVTGDTDLNIDVYERQNATTTTLKSTGPAGGNGAFDAILVGHSDDGTRVLFDTQEKLTTNDTDANFFDVYDRIGSTTTLLSAPAAGSSAAFDVFFAGLSTDGDVVLDTDEKLLVADTDSAFDTYVRQSATLSLVSKGVHAGSGAFDVTFTGMTPDGASIFLHSNEQLTVDDTDAVQDVFRATEPGLGQVRPLAAAAVTFSLVPSFDACITPNRTHGPPLVHGSCTPPAASSTSITPGTPDSGVGGPVNFSGFVKAKVFVGVPGPPDDSNVSLQVSMSDIRCRAGTTSCGAANAAGGNDYTGQVQAKLPLRITDRWNTTTSGGGPDAATMVDNSLDITIGCVASASTGEGSSCSVTTTATALSPGLVRDGKRAVWAVNQVSVADGGTDGLVSTASGNKTFARAGVFVP